MTLKGSREDSPSTPGEPARVGVAFIAFRTPTTRRVRCDASSPPQREQGKPEHPCICSLTFLRVYGRRGFAVTGGAGFFESFLPAPPRRMRRVGGWMFWSGRQPLTQRTRVRSFHSAGRRYVSVNLSTVPPTPSCDAL